MRTTKKTTPRKMRDKPVSAIRAVTFTDDDASCYPQTGLCGRRVREAVRAFGIHHARLGKRMIVLVADWEAAVSRASSPGETIPADDEDGQPETADAVLAALGRRRSA